MRGYERGIPLKLKIPPIINCSSIVELEFSQLGLPSSWVSGPGMGQGLTLGLVDWVGDTWWMLDPARPVLVLAAVCLPGLWPAVLPCRAHCVQSQTPHYRRDAAKLEAVQRRAGRAVWSGGGLVLVLSAGEGRGESWWGWGIWFSRTQQETWEALKSQHLERPSPAREEMRTWREAVGDPDTSQHWTQPSSFPTIKCHLPVTTSATVIMTEEMPLPQSGGQKEQAAIQEGPSLPVPILSIVTLA